jgi:hypothetical protein
LPQSRTRAKLYGMTASPFLIQFAVSLGAIFALAGLCLWLGLGRDPRLESTREARELADQVHSGFVAETCAIDTAGKAALLRDAEGKMILLKAHGGHFAGRLLELGSHAEAAAGGILVTSAEPRFGGAHMTIDNAQDWAAAINAIGHGRHA